MLNRNITKGALLAHKKQLLEEIKYSQKSIDELRTKLQNKRSYYETDSSDSEDFFPIAVDKGKNLQKLKYQHAMLKTCQHATQELTGLVVLQSEVNVLVEDPQFEGERPIPEPGTWREVTAECRLDLVPFTITFLTHTGNQMFAPTSYRALKTSLVKTAHEVELNNSVLQAMRTPSDAVEVIRSYASAFRSRRTTLAHLANRYANSLFMEPHPEGGFVLKCANLLEILWRLENKWSPLVPFHHRLKFDLEYMDESYVKIITQAHKELLDPSIQTDERTLLLAKIIATCLEARGPVDSESDLESVGVMSKKTVNQTELNPKDKDTEVMAPPKKVPKKVKTVSAKDKDMSKDKGNAQKRALQDVNLEENVKKMKSTADASKNIQLKGHKNDNKGDNDHENKDDEIKKKSIDKTGVKTSQINKVKASVKKSNQNDSNKKNNEDNFAKKRKHDDDNVTETVNVNVHKQIKNAKIRSSNIENNVRNIETGAKNSEATKDANKSAKPTKTEKRQKIVNNTEEELPSQNINNKENNKKEAKSNNENSDPTKKITKNAKMLNNHVGKENSKSMLPKTNDKKDKISNAFKHAEKENKKFGPAKTTEKKSKNSVVKDNNKPENNENDGTQQSTNKKAKSSVINDNVRPENNKSAVIQKTTDIKAKNSVVVDNITPENNEGDVPQKAIDKTAKMTKKVGKEINKNIPEKKIDRKTKMSIANDKKFDIVTKKGADIQTIGSKNDNLNEELNNAVDKNLISNHDRINKNIEKESINTKYINNVNTKSNEIIKNKTTGKTKTANQLVKHTKTKDGVTTIKKQAENKTINKPNIVFKNTDKKIPKITTKSVRDIIHKSPLHQKSLKQQNSRKSGNSMIPNKGNKLFSSNTEKGNTEKTGIPQKKISNVGENLKNILRMSPRNLSSKFKTNSKEIVKSIVKNTNIPRLMKKPMPRTSK